MSYKEIKGDLIKLAKEGKFDVVAHGCNCFCTMGAGIAPQMARAFGADNFPMEHESMAGDINKLGQIDWELVHNGGFPIAVVNCYTQYGFGANHKDGERQPGDYEALILCVRKMNKVFKGKRVGLPLMGCGLAGLDWEIVKQIFKEELKDCEVTVVHYEKEKENGVGNTKMEEKRTS